MSAIYNSIYEVVIQFLTSFDKTVTTKPFVSLIFPVSGFGAAFIPTDVVSNYGSNFALSFIDAATPYLKFLFLILTVLLTILSLILQLRKLTSKKQSDE
jgi:hypothetical protein